MERTRAVFQRVCVLRRSLNYFTDGTVYQLRPSCVSLSQAALELRASASSKAIQDAVVSSLTAVHRELVEIISKDPQAVDDKIADYVYFPIDHVLDQFRKVSGRALELACASVFALLQSAWRVNIPPVLAIRLLDRLSPLMDKENADKITEELVCQTLKCVNLTFSALGSSPVGSSIAESKNIPHVGQAVFEVLQQIEDGPSVEIQRLALTAINTFVQMYPDRVTLGTKFLPGIVSTLSKVLAPKATGRRTTSVIVASIQLLSLVLVRMFGETVELAAASNHTEMTTSKAPNTKRELSPEWTTKAVSQIKVVIGNVVKFRSHERREVRSAGNLLLDDKLSGLLEEIAHDWVLALPRLSQTSDPVSRLRSLEAIKLTIGLFSDSDSGISILQQSLITNLLESTLLSIPKALPKASISEGVFGHAALDSIPTSHIRGSTVFSPVFRDSSNDQDALTTISSFVSGFPSSELLQNNLDGLLASVEYGSGEEQMASFWLSLNILRAAIESDTTQFLNIESESSPFESLEQLYALSLAILEESDANSSPWQLQALALECIAEQAHQAGEDFSLDLVDALFPVLQLIGSPVKGLRDHAAACLNIIAEACNYTDVRELIVSNADYLVNAVGLKLNAFETSAGAPMVLLMMVRLCGPSILPFIDDVVDTIFAALESFHGFPDVVELLFAVIKVIADEGVKAPQLEITAGGEDHRGHPIDDCTFEDVLLSIKKAARLASEEEDAIVETKGKDLSASNIDHSDDENDPTSLGTEDDAGKSISETKTYRLLFNISELTQHYLPYQSAPFRRSILSLLTITLPAISKHEDTLLPLINTLWPVVVVRIGDQEPYVAAAALDVVRTMCEYAGKFVKSRIQDEWHRIIGVLRTKTQGAVVGANSGVGKGTDRSGRDDKSLAALPRGTSDLSAPEPYVDQSMKSFKDSASKLILSIIENVRVNDDIFDEALALFSHQLMDLDIRSVFEQRNADAVWLAMIQLGQRSENSHIYEVFKPELERVQEPPGDGRWNFIRVV
ncbi:hypothetical protein P152DRAFT_435848 [Eremomyces bilateralis CBS 781.70]|uniref:ARM repeat-containing protein n=1 Tax=Eremomyces bilateralis CBS 781.70 TaxID=1392243 RepID=A0A6G1G396_9PEZI|nr:uncharacterized protein P152DRAFT_435848 [Eremomyces bilateralis CBS 781.70]KAF1812585.1 hypothetical protein P152DRAFT_435848 [Eremomyces bilateralis CBS 781.70]